MKELMFDYFKWYLHEKEENLQLYCIADNVDIYNGNPNIFVGKSVDGWIRWRPMEKEEQYDFNEFNDILKIEIHDSIKRYYNAYWFCTLNISFNEFEIEMYPIIPAHYIKYFLSQFLGYISAHDRKITHIPLGYESTKNLLLVIENETGKVQLEDYQQGKFYDLTDSLYSLLEDGN